MSFRGCVDDVVVTLMTPALTEAAFVVVSGVFVVVLLAALAWTAVVDVVADVAAPATVDVVEPRESDAIDVAGPVVDAPPSALASFPALLPPPPHAAVTSSPTATASASSVFPLAPSR